MPVRCEASRSVAVDPDDWTEDIIWKGHKGG